MAKPSSTVCTTSIAATSASRRSCVPWVRKSVASDASFRSAVRPRSQQNSAVIASCNRQLQEYGPPAHRPDRYSLHSECRRCPVKHHSGHRDSWLLRRTDQQPRGPDCRRRRRLKRLLANFAAGIFLVILQPFKVGDVVVAGGVTGTVEEVGLFVTSINTLETSATSWVNGKI